MSAILLFTQSTTGIQTDLNDDHFLTSLVNGAESTPANLVDALTLTRKDGQKKIGSQYDKRNVLLEGTLQGSDSTDLRSRLLAFKRDVAGDGTLDIQLVGEANAIRFHVTVLNIAITTANHHLSHVPYSIQLVAMDPPFGEDTDFTTLYSASGVSGDIQQTDELGGSAEPAVNAQITVPTVGNLEGIEFRNDDTNTGMLMERSFEANDTLVIDTGESSCRLNGSPADFVGQVPTFLPGANSWRLNFLTSNFTIDTQQGLYTTEKFIYGSTILAQSFEASGNINTQRVDIMLARLGNPTNVKLTIYTNSSGAPGTAIAGATATVSGNTIPTTPAYISFNLQNVVSLSASTTYWIVVEIIGAVNDVNNGVYWKVSSLNPYADGVFAKSTNSGSTWTDDADLDAVFRVWKTAVLASNTDTSQETYSEDFTTTTNKDAGNTTANWDTTNTRVTLGEV